MRKTKFTVRVDSDAFEAARQYAGQHGTTVTSLVEEFFRSLRKVEEVNLETPVLRALMGSLKPETSLDDYHAYLEEKYLANRKGS